MPWYKLVWVDKTTSFPFGHPVPVLYDSGAEFPSTDETNSTKGLVTQCDEEISLRYPHF